MPGRARAIGVILLAALALASLSARASPYHPLDAQQDTTGALEFVTEANLLVAQSFVTTADVTLTRIGLYVRDDGNDNSLGLRILRDAGGLPDDTTILGSALNNTRNIYEWANFTLTPALTVAAGTRYWVVADSQGGGSGNGYAWRYQNLDLYARGSAATAVNNAWAVQPGDMAFVLYGWSAAAVSLSVGASAAAASSGDAIRYTITLANTGTEDATDVWVNATLDPRLALGPASGPGVLFIAGTAVSFFAAAIPNGTSVFTLDTVATSLLGDGDLVLLPVAVDLTDGAGRRAIMDAAVVEIVAPRITTSLRFTPSTVPAGTVLSFFVDVENTGRLPSRNVWLNETLHPALTFLDSEGVPPPTQDGAGQSWHLTDVPVGRLSFNVTVQVDPRSADDTVVVNFLTVDYTDAIGRGRARDRTDAIWFRIAGPAAAAGNPWLWGSFAISATIVGGTYVGYARRRFRIEEIFLIHHSGVLLVHMSKSLKSDQDSDILSGMFTAVMNFVRDAFHYEERQELQGLDLGQFQVHVRKGSITYLALVHSGKSSRWMSRTVARAVQEVESQSGDMLRTWDGDVRALAGVREVLRGHFLSPTGPSQFPRWFRTTFLRAGQTFKPVRPL